MSVQVSLFIAPPSRATLPGPDHRRSRCLHFPSAHIQEKAGAHLALNPVTSNLYSGCDITDFTFFSMKLKMLLPVADLMKAVYNISSKNLLILSPSEYR